MKNTYTHKNKKGNIKTFLFQFLHTQEIQDIFNNNGLCYLILLMVNQLHFASQHGEQIRKVSGEKFKADK